VFFQKTKNPIIFESFSNPNPSSENIFALLPSKRIVPFQFPSHNGLMLAQNPQGHDFVIAVLKENGEFSVVASGAANDVNISQNLDLIYAAYNTKKINFSLIFTQRVRIPFLRYIRFCQIFYTNLYKKCYLVQRFSVIRFILLHLTIYFTMMPVNVLTFLIEYWVGCADIACLFWLTLCLPFFFFSIISWPYMVNLKKSFAQKENDVLQSLYPEHLDIFAIKPQKLMWKFPVLMKIENHQIFKAIDSFEWPSMTMCAFFFLDGVSINTIILIVYNILISRLINGEYE